MENVLRLKSAKSRLSLLGRPSLSLLFWPRIRSCLGHWLWLIHLMIYNSLGLLQVFCFLDFGFKPERDLIVINSIMFQILQKKKQSKIKKMIVWKEVWHFYSSSCCMNYKYIIMVKKIQEMLDQISL